MNVFLFFTSQESLAGDDPYNPVTARPQLEKYLAEPATYARLNTYVRRRGVTQDSEDLVQEAICDALAVRAMPLEQEQIPRWVNTILRRRVADLYRQYRRWPMAELDDIECHSQVENRDLLARVDRDVNSSAERATLGWLLREHAGESLKDLADESSVDIATLRQRICRLRRYLRATVLGVITGVLVVVAGAAWYQTSRRHLDSAASPAHSSYDGHYQLVDASIKEFARQGIQMTAYGGTVKIASAQGKLPIELTFQQLSNGSVVVHSATRKWETKVVDLGSGQLKLMSSRGYVILRRFR